MAREKDSKSEKSKGKKPVTAQSPKTRSVARPRAAKKNGVSTKTSLKSAAMKLKITQKRSVIGNGLAYPVISLDGKEVGSINLHPEVFDAPIRSDIVHAAVTWQRNRRRAGTHSTITRGEMLGGGKKPFKQKGTGRARQGSTTSPIFVGGGVAHGPQPRSYETRVPKRLRIQALRSVLTDKRVNNGLIIVDDFKIKEAKTKNVAGMLRKLGIDHEKVVIVLPLEGELLFRASRNIPTVRPLAIEGLNVYDLVDHSILLCSKGDVERIQERALGIKESEQETE